MSATRPHPTFIDQNCLMYCPAIPKRNVPLLRAMAEVGRAKFGEDWGDAEKVALFPPVGPERFQENENALRRIRSAYAEVRDAIVETCLEATFWYQGMSTLPPPLPVPFLTNADQSNLMRRGYIWKDRKSYLVFCDRAGLDSLIGTLPHSEAAISNDLAGYHISIELKLAIATIKGFGVTPDQVPSIPSLESYISKLARDWGASLSPRRVKEIARLIAGKTNG